jgi:hypothetical protein
VETATKQCRKCGEIKPAEEFYASRNSDGLSSWCRKCTSAKAAEQKRQARAEGRCTEQERAYRRDYFQRMKHDPAFMEKENARKRKWAADNPERARAYFLNRKNRHLYGLTTEQVLAMIATQGGRCAACRREFSIPVQGNGPLCPNVDHDHRKVKYVRGILCGDCNLAAGKLGDDWRRVELLAAYLKRHSEEDMV